MVVVGRVVVLAVVVIVVTGPRFGPGVPSATRMRRRPVKGGTMRWTPRFATQTLLLQLALVVLTLAVVSFLFVRHTEQNLHQLHNKLITPVRVCTLCLQKRGWHES